jgi:lipopolysaccharide heptosyltransferase II
MIGRRKREGSVVVQTAYLGNVILTTPLLGALATRYGPVDVVAQPTSAQVLEGHPAVRDLVLYDKRGADRGWAGVRRLARQLRKRAYARAYLPDPSWRAATLIFAARIRERVGFSQSPAAKLYTERVLRPLHGPESARIAALAGIPVGDPLPPLWLGLNGEDREAAAALLERWQVGEFVALAPGSVWGARRWPHFPALAAALSRPVVVIGGPADAALAEAVVAAAPDRAHSTVGLVSPRTSAALIERALVLVTNDSAALHLATAVGAPVVGLFGPTTPALGFGPLGPDDVVVGRDDLLCRPCAQPGPAVCPLEHHRCMLELDVAHVADALESVVRRVEERRAIRPGH